MRLERLVCPLLEGCIQAALTPSAALGRCGRRRASPLPAAGALPLRKRGQREDHDGRGGDYQSHQAISHIETPCHGLVFEPPGIRSVEDGLESRTIALRG